MGLPPRVPRTDEDDELDKLPDLDGGPEEQERDDAPDDDDPDVRSDLGEEARSDLDDLSSEDRDVFGQNDLDLEGEGSYLDGAEPGEEIDADLPEIPGSTVSLLDDHDAREEADDFDLDPGDTGPLDGGEEGPLDPDEELKDADLPALDADEGGEVDEATLFDALDEDAPLPWGEERWVAAMLDHGESFIAPSVPAADAEAARASALEAWGATLTRGEVVAAVRAGSWAMALVASLGEPRLWLVRGELSAPQPVIVAELEAAEIHDVRDMAWDEARGLVWISGAFGARAYQRAMESRSPS